MVLGTLRVINSVLHCVLDCFILRGGAKAVRRQTNVQRVNPFLSSHYTRDVNGIGLVDDRFPHIIKYQII